MTKTKKRIAELDIIRGILVLLLVIDHFFYDCGFFVNEMFNYELLMASPIYALVQFARVYWRHPLRKAIRQICLLLFFLISGICASFSKNNLKRSLKLMLFSAAATILSFGYSYLTKHWDFLINVKAEPLYWLFPIFFCYGFSIFTYEIIHRTVRFIMKRDSLIAPCIALLGGLAIIFVFIYYDLHNAPLEFYERDHFFEYVLGFSQAYEDFDSWPLFPFMGYLLIGVFTGFVLYREKKSIFFKEQDSNLFVKLNKPISFLGRHSLWVYILHQVIIVPILYGVFYLSI